ncbi:MAG: hypothetical protein IKL04_07930 [Lachnospiraceae bacterium]|nr:hypothetical protein [Lachnospiraceae bacterium]
MGFTLNNVLNNYLTTYSSKSDGKYDTHKKSELQKVYGSIVKLNKDAPWSLPATGEDTKHYALSLKENAHRMHHTLAGLGALDEEGLFSQKSAYSTDPSLATAAYVGPKTISATAPGFEVQVESLALPQENLGTFLSNDKIKLPPDTYSFDVAINDMNYEFQFTINEGETNRGIQERLVRLINNADIGLHAQLASADNGTALRLVSDSSGISAPHTLTYAITDDRTSKSAGAVAYLGLDRVQTYPDNARYTINGEPHTADSNRFTISGMFDVELHGAAPGRTVRIGLKTDVESLTDNILRLVSGYNEFLRTAADAPVSQAGSRKLIREITGIASVYHDTMASMGIHMEADGYLSVDEEALRSTALESEDVSSTFRYLKNLSGRLLQKSTEVALNPMEYVDRKIVAYKNPGRNFVSPYTPSAYSGMMFNRYY